MKNREDTEMVGAFKSCYNELNGKSHHLTLAVLDNECSHTVTEYITLENTDLQFAESHNHIVNATKHDCKTTKYHTIATVCTIAPTCPIQLYAQCMTQTKATLNSMQTSRRNTNKLTYKAIN